MSAKKTKNISVAEESFEDLNSEEISVLCNMFLLKTGGSKKDKIKRLLNQPDRTNVEKAVRLAKQIKLGYLAIDYLTKDYLKDILYDHDLPISGNKFELYMQLVENSTLSPEEILGAINVQGIRDIFEQLFEEPAVESEHIIKTRILQWLDFYLVEERSLKKSLVPDVGTPPYFDMITTSEIPKKKHDIWPIYGRPGKTDIESDISKEAPDRYEVAISYAGEDKKIAEELAKRLRDKNIKVFIDRFSQADLWGKNLSNEFKELFGPKADYVLTLISKHYVVKDWTDFEFTVARGEAKKRNREFILPIRLDNAPMVGLRSDICYLDYRKDGPKVIVNTLLQKLGKKTPSKNTSKSITFLCPLCKSKVSEDMVDCPHCGAEFE